jgi:hypothetical protein
MMGYDQERQQVNAHALLDGVHAYRRRQKLTDPVLLVVSQDLFRDGHSFVFGLAREPAGLVSDRDDRGSPLQDDAPSLPFSVSGVADATCSPAWQLASR